MSEKTFGYKQCVVKDTKIESLLRRISFQVADDYSKLFCIEKSIPYEIQIKLEKKSTLGQEVLIGKGSFGNVYLTKHLRQGIPCALKVHHNISDEELLYQTNEYVIQAKLNQINEKLFVKLIDKIYIKQLEINNYTTFAGLELGIFNLYNYLMEVQINEQEFQSIYYSILESIITMHDHSYAHRDIKPQNILYVERKGWVLSDFGCSIKYKNVKGEYEICGTKAFLPLQYRKLVKQNFTSISTEMNLLQIDIYAFQITLLQILNPKAQINQLQEILDNCQPSHPLIELLYNKSLEQLKLILQSVFYRIEAQNVDSTVTKALKFKESQPINQTQLIKYKLKKLEMMIYNSSDYSILIEYLNDLQEFCKQCTVENQTYIKIVFCVLKDTKLEVDINALEINESTKSWQYNIIQDCLDHFGYLKKRYENCIKYQKVKNKTNMKYKIEQCEIALLLGLKNDARHTLNEIQDQAYYCNDIYYLKYYYYKAKLNNEWWEIQEQVIQYFKHIHQSNFILEQIFPEIYYLRNQQEELQNYVYDDKEYSDYSTLDSYQTKLLLLEKWGNYDQEKLRILLRNRGNFISNNYTTLSSYIEGMKNIGHQNFSIIVELNEMAFHYQLEGNFQLAQDVCQELLKLNLDEYPNLQFIIYMNYALLLQEIGNYEVAYEFALKASQKHKEDLFQQIQCHQLLWYIKIQLNAEDCVDSFEYLMNLYKQFLAKKMKFGLIKRVYYGFQILVTRGFFDSYEQHLALFVNCIEFEDQALESPDYSYLLHVLRWDLYYYQRKFNNLLNEFNNFLKIIQTSKLPFDDRAIILQSNLASLGYYEAISEIDKTQLFSKYLQSLIIQADLFELNEKEKALSRKFALNQYLIATEENLEKQQIGLKISEQLIDHYI